MGLDQYVTARSGETPKVDPPSDGDEVFYWRKHANLQGFITDRYVAAGGADLQWGSMTGSYRLDEDDLDAIEKATLEGTLPHTTGFFFGQSTDQKDEQTLEFIEKARAALREGKTLVYSCWW